MVRTHSPLFSQHGFAYTLKLKPCSLYVDKKPYFYRQVMRICLHVCRSQSVLDGKFRQLCHHRLSLSGLHQRLRNEHSRGNFCIPAKNESRSLRCLNAFIFCNLVEIKQERIVIDLKMILICMPTYLSNRTYLARGIDAKRPLNVNVNCSLKENNPEDPG